jgi:regulator of nucleoside diphosphate kinase
MFIETVQQASAVQPRVLLSGSDFTRLRDLARATLARHPIADAAKDAQFLLEELDRADIVPPDWIPAGVVGMNSYVEFRDDPAGTVRRLQLVYPYQANLEAGRLSVLSLVGAALIGLTEGKSITWEGRDGRERRLTVLRTSGEPFIAGG